VVPLAWFIEHPSLPRSDQGLLYDLTALIARKAPAGSVRCLIAGGALPDAAELAAPPGEQPRPALVPTPTRVRERVTLVGQGLSRIARGVIGPARHDRLWHRAQLLRLRDWLERPPLPRGARALAAGDEAYAAADLRRRDALVSIAREPPLLVPRRRTDEPALLIAVPGIWHGGADRAVIDLLHGITRIAPTRRRFVINTEPTPMKWADQLLPHVDGVFSLPALARDAPDEALAQLIDRLGVTALLIMHSRAAFEALPRLRRDRRPLRVWTQLHCFDPDPVTGAESGFPVLAASRFNNLVDGYATISRRLGDEMCARYYVSPTKVHAVRLGIDVARFAEARRPRFEPDRRVNVLWLGRVAEQKDPLTALRVARAFRARHGSERLHFNFVGDGPLAERVRAQHRADRLDDVMTISSGVADPRPLYRDADCLMLTSRYEGIPVVLYEAMACALPVIAPIAETAIPEVVAPDEIYYVDRQDDADEYVALLERLLADRSEPRARAERLAARAPEFGLERYAREMLGLLFP
jgi:glycosyltransferase involved in cell wall biosynthesis